MVLAKLGSLVSTFPGPGLPAEWVSTGSPANVTGNAVQIPAATDFITRITTQAFYDPTSSSIFGKLLLSTPRSYTTTPPAPVFTPYNRIGVQQPGGAQCKVISGIIPGFTVGQQAHGQMKPTIDNLEALIGDHIEGVGVGLPNQMGDCSKVLDALSGETRFIKFAMPMVPHWVRTGDTVGSIHDLLNHVYDALIIDTVTKMVAAGFGGTNVSCAIGWEFNAGSGKGPTDGFEWATNYVDPKTGVANGISQYKLAAAYIEALMVANGYTGYIEWNGGTADSSALPIASAMPTHATGTRKARTIWGWDLYPGPGFNVDKNNLTAIINQYNGIYDTYLTYVKANGYMMAHGEYGMTYKASSPYSPNDNATWFPWFYAKLAANAAWVAYAMFYQQNQPYTPGTVLDESHQIVFCGGRQGVPSTTVGTGPFPIGATGLNQTGSAHTAATMGTLHNVADSGTWVFTNDPNKALAKSSWVSSFAGGSSGKGAAHLGVPYVVPAGPTTTGPKAQIILTPGGAHNPAVGLLLEFDYNQTQSSITTNFLDDGTGVNTAAVATPSIWWRIRDDGTSVHWETSTDSSTWTNLRTATRPSWWNATDGVKVSITSHNDDGTQTISPLVVSNINNTSGTTGGGGGGTDLAIFDKFNVSPAPPGGVRNLLSHISGNTVALTWDAPSTGITQGYTINATPLNTSSPNLPAQTVTTTAATFLNVLPGSSYVFTVTPFNSAGAGPGVATNAVSITSTGTTGGTTGGGTSTGTPTPALGALLPNALPVAPLPVAYFPLTLTDGPDDGDSLANAAIQRMANLIGQGWRPYVGNPEVAAVMVTSYIAADLRALVRAAGDALYSAFGQQILQLPQHVDSPSQIVTTWTALDTIGHTIPAGTQVSYPGAGSTPLTFTTRGDIIISSGESSITGIVMLSDQTGAYTNGVPTGPLEIQGSIIWLDSVVVTTAATGGQDAEDDQAYRTRLVEWVKSLSLTAVLPMDYAMAAQQLSSAVYRAYAVPNYDANNPSTSNVDRTVSVFLLTQAGLPVPPDVAASVAAQLQSLRETNFHVVVLDNDGNAVSPVYVNVTITATVVTRSGYAQADVKHACEQALGDYLDPAFWEGGFTTPPSWSGRTVIRPHDLSTILAGVPGVDHIDSLTVGGGATPIAGTDNFQLSPPSFTRAVLPAGTYTGSHWSTPSAITVTANAPT